MWPIIIQIQGISHSNSFSLEKDCRASFADQIEPLLVKRDSIDELSEEMGFDFCNLTASTCHQLTQSYQPWMTRRGGSDMGKSWKEFKRLEDGFLFAIVVRMKNKIEENT